MYEGGGEYSRVSGREKCMRGGEGAMTGPPQGGWASRGGRRAVTRRAPGGHEAGAEKLLRRSGRGTGGGGGGGLGGGAEVSPERVPAPARARSSARQEPRPCSLSPLGPRASVASFNFQFQVSGFSLSPGYTSGAGLGQQQRGEARGRHRRGWRHMSRARARSAG